MSSLTMGLSGNNLGVKKKNLDSSPQAVWAKVQFSEAPQLQAGEDQCSRKQVKDCAETGSEARLTLGRQLGKRENVLGRHSSKSSHELAVWLWAKPQPSLGLSFLTEDSHSGHSIPWGDQGHSEFSMGLGWGQLTAEESSLTNSRNKIRGPAGRHRQHQRPIPSLTRSTNIY